MRRGPVEPGPQGGEQQQVQQSVAHHLLPGPVPVDLTGELRLPAGDGAASFVDAGNIAAVAVAALTEGGHVGETYELSGPRALTSTEAAAEISWATGRDLRYVPLSPERFVTGLTGQGWSPAAAEDYAEAVSPIRRGLDAHLSDGVQRALGRPPGDCTAHVSAAVAAWRH